MIQDILYITKNQSFLTKLHKTKLARVLNKAKKNTSLEDNELRDIKQMKRRIKMFLVSNRMNMNSRLNRVIRESITTPSKDIA